MALLRVDNERARNFYLRECEAAQWSVRQLERQNVRMYDELKRQPDDAPTIGLILCADNDKTVMRYSSLNGSTQLFASKYKFLLPTEEEIRHLLSERSDIPSNGTSNQET